MIHRADIDVCGTYIVITSQALYCCYFTFHIYLLSFRFVVVNFLSYSQIIILVNFCHCSFFRLSVMIASSSLPVFTTRYFVFFNPYVNFFKVSISFKFRIPLCHLLLPLPLHHLQILAFQPFVLQHTSPDSLQCY